MGERCQPLIGVDALADRVGAGDCVVVDCRFRLDDLQAGSRDYDAGHIPGAVYAHLEADLAGPVGADGGRHPLPDPDALAIELENWGISHDTLVVAYDEVTGPFAARLWWLLGWLGHERAAVLDGGWRAWTAAGMPVSTARPRCGGGSFAPRPGSRATVSSETLAARLAESRWQIIDARASERFRGVHEPLDPVAGHIPGAVNHPWTDNLDDAGYLLAPAKLDSAFRALIGEVPADAVVSSCGSGVTACHNLLALAAAGRPGARLHPGSWSEWLRDPERPVARGP